MEANLNITGNITGKIEVDGTLSGTIDIGGGAEPKLQSKIISDIGLGVQRYTADQGYDGLELLTVTSAFREMHYPQNIQVDDNEIWLYAPDNFSPVSYTKIRFKNRSNVDLQVYEAGGGQATPVNLGEYTQEIAESAFDGWTGLAHVIAPALITINNRGFYNSDLGILDCSQTSDAVQIGMNAFKDCTHLTDIYFRGPKAHLSSSSAFSGTSGVTVHCPASVLSEYQADAMWSGVVQSYGVSFVAI